MTEMEQPCYIIINSPTDAEALKDTQLKNDIENGNLKIKVEALKKLVFGLLNGEKLPSYMLILVIRYLLPSQDHQIKKLLLLFWEIVPKRNAAGKLLPEMILVCDAYRKDLQHPNEFVRGSTLRFLCKLKEPELLEPLMPSIRSCLEHKHSYVRRNAVLAIYTIYRNFEFLIPDAPELISNFLEAEQDASCKRNAFIMLIHADQERALNYLHSCIDQVQSFNEILQLVIVELIYKVCHHNPSERARFIRCIYNLLNSTSSSVRYEAAGTLVAISSAPTAVKAASSCYIDLIVKESDNNVKLIVLDRLLTLKDQHVNNEKVLQEMMMDILRLLNSTDLEVRRKTLELALELVSSRNVEDLIGVLRKEVQKTQGLMELQDDTLKYRQLLVRTLHNCCLKFPDYLSTVIPLLVEFLSDPNDLAACDVILLLRESVQRHPHLSQTITSKLLEIFPMIRSINIFRGVLWILGEYCDTLEEMDIFLSLIEQSLGKIPIVEECSEDESGEDGVKGAEGGEREKEKGVGKKEESSGRPMITPDGTYATQSALSSATTASTGASKGSDTKLPPLREFLMNGDFFIAASLANSLTKLAFHYDFLEGSKPADSNAFFAKIMLILAAILRLGQSAQPKKMITLDDSDRIMLCLKALAEKPAGVKRIFTKSCRNSLLKMLEMSQKQSVSVDPSNPAIASKRKDNKSYMVQPDQIITFLPLVKSSDLETAEDQFEVSMMRAMGVDGKAEGERDVTLSSKLNKVTQLTGFSDPIYAEAYVHVNQYDISLDVLIVNQTDDTLQNLDLELATLGDLKLVEKPVPVTLGPNDFCNIKASIKVTSTENGIIFGNIVYDVGSGVGDRNVVVLNDVHVDIVDYIAPGTVSDADFRHMWAEFEWENKVSVNTNLTDLNLFLAHVIKSTNMRCLTPQQALGGECGFLAANLYAKSIFGEDALANISLEKLSKADTTITGHVRIRAKTQGMALSLGDKINQSQKKN